MFAYFDETIGGDTSDKLDAVAGYLFDVQGHEHFLSRYRKFIEPLIPADEQGRKVFHAATCFNGRPPYDRTQRPIRETIMARMATVIGESVVMGFVACVEHKQYRLGRQGRYIKLQTQGQPNPNGVSPWIDSMYSMCLHRCIDGMNQWVNLERPDVSSIKYVVEHGSPQQNEAHVVLKRIGDHPRLRDRYRFEAYEFVKKGPEHPWLFAADFFAWYWQRYDRLIEEGRAQHEEILIQPALDAKPHLSMYMMEGAVNTHALVNAFYGLVRPPRRE